MKKKIIYIAIAVAAVILYLLYKLKRGSGDQDLNEIIENATTSAANEMSSLFTDNKSAVTSSMYSAEDTAYNDAVRRYQLLYKTQPSSTWTTDEIEERINDYNKIQSLISTYVLLEAEYDEGNTVKTERELSRMNASELQTLVNQLKKQNRKTEWNMRKTYIQSLVNAFYDNMTNVGTWLGDCKGYDTNTFSALIALKSNERVYANQYFGTLGGVNVGSSWLKITKHPELATTISGAIPKIGDSVDRDRASHSQVGKAEAMRMSSALKSEYSTVFGSVNEFGDIA